MTSKILYLLIGPKGAGKTYIGTLVDRHTDIQFIRVKSIWLNLQPREDGWQKVEQCQHPCEENQQFITVSPIVSNLQEYC